LSHIRYKLPADVSVDELPPAEQRSLTDEYKAESLQKMTDHQLAEIIMSQPTILIENPDPERGIVSHKIELEPLTNLTFCRDQQITTAKGVVMSCMNMIQRVFSPLLFGVVVIVMVMNWF
jgi:arginine deiminase